MKLLTVRQERFCLALLIAPTATDAYLSAYNCVASNRATIKKNASRLRARPEIQARYEELTRYVLAEAFREPTAPPEESTDG